MLWRYGVMWGTLVALSIGGGCTDEEGWVDRPDAVWANPDSVRVSEITRAYAVGCPPGYALCVGRVRDLRWAVADTTIARIAGELSEQSVAVRGVRSGQTWIIGIGRAGRDSGELRVIP